MNTVEGKNGELNISKERENNIHNYIFDNSLKYYVNIPKVFVTFIQIPLFEKYFIEQDLNLFKKFLENIKIIYLIDN